MLHQTCQLPNGPQMLLLLPAPTTHSAHPVLLPPSGTPTQPDGQPELPQLPAQTSPTAKQTKHFIPQNGKSVKFKATTVNQKVFCKLT